MGRRLITILEILLFTTLFALFAGMVITTHSNDAIVEHTEEFVELVRYKGCITKQMYDDFLDGFSTPVEVRMTVTKENALTGAGSDLESMVFTQDIVNRIVSDPNDLYPMYVGDEIEVVVRRPGRSMYSTILGSLGGGGAKGETNPVVAVKGGMILNEQWQ